MKHSIGSILIDNAFQAENNHLVCILGSKAECKVRRWRNEMRDVPI